MCLKTEGVCECVCVRACSHKLQTLKCVLIDPHQCLHTIYTPFRDLHLLAYVINFDVWRALLPSSVHHAIPHPTNSKLHLEVIHEKLEANLLYYHLDYYPGIAKLFHWLCLGFWKISFFFLKIYQSLSTQFFSIWNMVCAGSQCWLYAWLLMTSEYVCLCFQNFDKSGYNFPWESKPSLLR